MIELTIKIDGSLDSPKGTAAIVRKAVADSLGLKLKGVQVEQNGLPENLVPFKGKHLLVVRVPLEIVFSQDPVELEGEEREAEPKATEDQIREYIESGAVICDVNLEDHSQMTGAIFNSMALKMNDLKVYRP